MVWLSRSEVPVYLREGSFYNDLDVDDGEFEVPDQCCKWNADVACDHDLTFLLHTLRFWGVAVLPVNAVRYLRTHKRRRYTCKELMRSFPELQDVWKQLEGVMSEKVSIAEAIRLRCGVEATRALFWRDGQKRLSADDCIAAATVDDLPSLTFLRENFCPWDDRTIITAVQSGSVLCLQYALTNRCLIKSDLMELALSTGQVESAKCLLRNGVRITSALASRNWQHLSVLFFIHQLGYSTPFLTCELCAAQNRVDVLQYLHNLGHPWDESTCAAAARVGSLECLTYAHTHGCPWNATTTNAAALSDHAECLRYACEDGCPVSADPWQVLEGGNYACAIYLPNNRYRVSEFARAMLCITVMRLVQYCLLTFVVVPCGLMALGAFPWLASIAFVLVAFMQGTCSLVYTQAQSGVSMYESLRDGSVYFLFHFMRVCLFVAFGSIVSIAAVCTLVVYFGAQGYAFVLDRLGWLVQVGVVHELGACVKKFCVLCVECVLVPVVLLSVHIARWVHEVGNF